MLTARFENTRWKWLPLTWFAEIGHMGCHRTAWQLGSQGAFSILGTIVIVFFGLRSFSGTYLLEAASTATRGRSWRKHDRSVLFRSCAAVVRFATGSSLGLGIFYFVGKMIRRDFLFRRTIPIQTWIPFIAIVGIVVTFIRSGGLSGIHFLPHLFGLVSMAICINLQLSFFNQSSWMYLTTPISNTRSFAHGIFGALWIWAIALPNLALLGLLLRFLNWKDALSISGFSLIVASLYLCTEIRWISGLPFSSPANETRAMVNGIYIQICGFLVISIPFMAHEALVERFWTTLVAAIVLLIAIRFVFRANLEKLGKEMLWRLYLLKMGPNQMFREMD